MSILASTVGIVETLKTVGEVIKAVNSNSSSDPNSSNLKGAISNGNFIKIVRSGLIEPIILVTENSLYQDDLIDKINNIIVDNFMAFYTQVFTKITSTGLVTPIEAIDIMSTNLNTINDFKNRTSNYLIQAGQRAAKDMLSKEQLTLNNLNFDLSSLYLNDSEINTIKSLATESNLSNYNEKILANKERQKNYSVSMNTDEVYKNIYGNDSYLYKTLIRNFELCLGIPVTQTDKEGNIITAGHRSLTIPMTIRANIKVVSTDEIAVVCGSNDKSKSFLARYHEWRSGGIGLWELIFCSDLIKDDKVAKTNKDSSLLKALENANIAAEVRKRLTGQKGFETMYSSLVITAEELDYLGKINNTDYEGKSKNQLLSMLNGFMLVVIDNSTVRIHMKDINGVVTVNHKSLRRRGDGDNNVLDFFKSITTGNAIRF